MGKTFGARSTGDEVLAGINLSGRTAVVTGGTAGLGLETVRALAAAGAHVVLTARTVERGQRAADEVKATGLKGEVSVQPLDLSDLASVRSAAAQLAKLPRIDLLILNAGVMGTPKGSTTKDGFELQLGTNHIGGFVLTEGLLPKLKSQSFPSRIVVLSSKGHYLQRAPLEFGDLHYARRKYSAFGAYAQSKTANVLFTKELAKRLEGTQVTAFAVHPGSIRTSLSRTWAPPGGWLDWLIQAGLAILRPLISEVKSIPQGVATTIFAATAPGLEAASGAYLSDCRIVAASKTGRDQQQAAKLWEVTEAQVKAAESPGGFQP